MPNAVLYCPVCKYGLVTKQPDTGTGAYYRCRNCQAIMRISIEVRTPDGRENVTK
mgnify:FL=1